MNAVSASRSNGHLLIRWREIGTLLLTATVLSASIAAAEDQATPIPPPEPADQAEPITPSAATDQPPPPPAPAPPPPPPASAEPPVAPPAPPVERDRRVGLRGAVNTRGPVNNKVG